MKKFLTSLFNVVISTTVLFALVMTVVFCVLATVKVLNHLDTATAVECGVTALLQFVVAATFAALLDIAKKR